MTGLAERLAQIRLAISDECLRLQRVEPTLIIVTKNHSVTLAEQLYELGERDFGENRVQEAFGKASQFSLDEKRDDVRWHLIGQLQTNKVKQALTFANSIHSLDRLALLEELVKRTVDRSDPLEVFIQVNLTDDPQRGGVQANELLSFADLVAQAPKLNLSGLMAVAGLDTDPKKDFELVAKLSESLISEHETATKLSIGMSGDYLDALQFGATHLRIGTAITGNRQY